ncbi:signal peptidase II [bacterium]|nr:signal peptidase II [bacterium]
MTNGKRYLPFLLTLLVIFLDRTTKIAVVSNMKLHESKPFLGDLVRWTYIHNDGMVFGMDVPQMNLLIGFSIIAAIVVLIILLTGQDEPRGMRWILGAILGGAIGNTYDRIAYGYVIDFVDVDFPNWIMDRFAVFNIADAAVSVGVTVLLLLFIFQKPTPVADAAEPPEMGYRENEAEYYTDLNSSEPVDPETSESEATQA